MTMRSTLHRIGSLSFAAIGIAALVGCGGSSGSDDGGVDDGGGGAAESCSVRLYDGDNFTDDSILISGAGRYGDLSKLPGASKDWTREADSFKLGSGASMTAWPEANFAGAPKQYEVGTQEPSADPEPGSLELTCE